MSTFIGQLIGFAVIVFLVWKYVVPPVRRLMTARQETVRKQLTDSADAKKKLEEATRAHEKAIAEAKAETKVVVDEARADAERIAMQMREQADAEVERVKVQGERQIQFLRAQLIRQLRQDLGIQSVNRADELVRDHVADPNSQSATVDRFIDELDAMAPSTVIARSANLGKLRSASRLSVSATVERFEEVSAGLDSEGLTTLSDELVAIAKVLIREPILTRHLTQPTEKPSLTRDLADRLLSGKVGTPTLDVFKAAVSGRWSENANLIHAVKHIAQLALLARADRDGEADEVEEQLFRFGRILTREPQLSTLLSEYSEPAEARIGLLKKVLGSAEDVNSTVVTLLAQTIELLHGERADEAVTELAELAVARRGEVVAEVTAPAELSDAQRRRLTEVLGRVYNHPISLHLQIDPSVLGGLSISVGDEVIDGTLSARLVSAKTHLPD